MLALLDSWVPRDSKGKQDILAYQDPRVTVESRVPLAAVAGLDRRVSLVPWDPREDPDRLATLGHQDLRASQAPQESLLRA